MKKLSFAVVILFIISLLVSCTGKAPTPTPLSNADKVATRVAATLSAIQAAAPSPSPSPLPATEQPSATPTTVAVVDQPSVSLDPCTLITAAEAEAILGQPVGPASPMNGVCAYNNASNAIYMVSAAAAQNQDAGGILQGQMMMLGLGGVQLDEARVNKLRTLAQGSDFKGFFTELVAISQGAPTMTTRLIDGGGNDVAYWVWVKARDRRQGGLVVVRGQTLVNINLIVADTQAEDAMLTAATSLANQVFGRLPAKFTLAIPATQAPPPTPTIVVKTIVGIWERHSTDVTERLVFSVDGTYSIEARKNSTNAIIASTSGTFTYDNNTIHYVDKSQKKTDETYKLSKDGNRLVMNNQTDRSWTRIQ